jgi:heme-degrading monooxygenase HmoA
MQVNEEGEMALHVVLSVDIKSGEEEIFEREFEDVARKLKDSPGLLGQMLCRALDSPSRYLIISNWASREEFRRFEVSPEQDEATAPVRRHRSSVQMHLYEVVYGDTSGA